MGNADSKVSEADAIVAQGGGAVKPSIEENEGTEASTDGSISNKEEGNVQPKLGDTVKRRGVGQRPSKKPPGVRISLPAKGKTANTNHQVQSRDDEQPAVSLISDDQVQVNLAMSDLMAYLQVVANNSSNLPITKRDDPELDRFVTSLSSEEYARKAAAFVPADVRMIGGAFSRYGQVWDLPSSEVRVCCERLFLVFQPPTS
jgi:hypothetical protein